MIDSFRGENSFLSNFYEEAGVKINYSGLTYRNTEAAFQAQKEVDPNKRKAYASMSASESKKAGRKAKLVFGWDDKKDDVMLDVLRIKFSYPHLAQKLVKTYPHELVEGNTWGDRYWGICEDEGLNKLGKLLMQVRKEIMDAQAASKEE